MKALVVLMVLVRAAAAQETVPIARPSGTEVSGESGSSQFVVKVEQVWTHFSGDDIEAAAREDAMQRDVDMKRATVKHFGSRIVIREGFEINPSFELLRFELVYIPWGAGATVVQFYADDDVGHWEQVARKMIAETTPTPPKSFAKFGSYTIEIPRRVQLAPGAIIDGPNLCRIDKSVSPEPLDNEHRLDHLWDFETELSSGETVRCRADGRNAARALGAILRTMRRRANLDTLGRIHELLK